MGNADDSTDDGLSTVASGAALVFGGRVMKLLLLFGVQILMARVLGATSYGGIVLATMVAGVGTIVATAGLDAGMTRNVPHYEDDTTQVRGVVKGGVQLALVLGTAVTGVLLVVAPMLATHIFDDPSLTPLLRIGAISIPVLVLGTVTVSIAQGARDAKTHVVVRQLLGPFAEAVLVGSLVGFGAIGAMTGRVLASVVGTVAALILVRRALPFSIRGPTTPMRRELLLFSLPLMFSASMDFLVVQADTLLIGTLRTSAEVGIYNVAFQIRQVGMFFFYPITFLLPPVLTRLIKGEKRTEAKHTYQVATKWMVLSTTPIVAGMILFPDVVLNASFGSQYTTAAPALRILMVPIIVTTLLGANGAALVALGHNRINLYVNAGAAVLNVVLNLLLIPPFGIVGGALASATVFVIRDISYTAALYRWHGIHPFSGAMLKPFVLTLPLAAAGYLLFVEFVTVSLLSVLAAGLVALMIYAPLVVVAGAVEPADARVLVRFEESTGREFGRLRRLVRRLSVVVR